MNPSTCVDPQFTNCVIWNGPDISCLKICKGQSVSKVIETIALKLCAALEPFDLSTLTLDCALEVFSNQEPTNRTIQNVLQLLLDNDCGLKELIDGIQAQLDGTSGDSFVIDLKCLKQTDSFGNTIAYDRDGVLQLFVNEICTLKTNVSYLLTKTTELQNLYNNIDFTPTITEGSIITCIKPTLLPVSQQVIAIATDYCNYKTIVGSSADIAIARGRVPADINLKYGTEVGWIAVPQNWVQDYNNLNIIVGKLISDIETIKTNCCQFDCDSIKIGFGIESTDDGVVLVFSSLYGNQIPNGFVDNGTSLMIIEEGSTNTQTAYITIQNNYSTPEIVLTGFNTGKTLTFVLDSRLINSTDDTVCEKTITKTYKYSGACCVLSNVGSEDAIILYETTINGHSG